MNQERRTVPTQSKQKETSSVFPFSLICCLMSALADVSAPQAGSIFLPSADSSACCYVFCLHSKFPDCLSQMITSLAGPVLCFKTLPKAEAFQVCTHQQRELPEREHGCVAPWKGPPRCPRPPATCQHRHKLLSLNTVSGQCPGYQQEEKGSTGRIIHFSLLDSTASYKTLLCY